MRLLHKECGGEIKVLGEMSIFSRTIGVKNGRLFFPVSQVDGVANIKNIRLYCPRCSKISSEEEILGVCPICGEELPSSDIVFSEQHIVCKICSKLPELENAFWRPLGELISK